MVRRRFDLRREEEEAGLLESTKSIDGETAVRQWCNTSLALADTQSTPNNNDLECSPLDVNG